jgi:FtsP/CotA-like multicopper oxidase with cupredoxin domain
MKPTIKHFELTASEFEWKVSNNKTVHAWGFNESVPGPIIRAKKGDIIEVKVINNLTESTLIHWHGVRLNPSMDGTSDVQAPIIPGEDFTYRFSLPDAGTFWYHSHHNETHQMERGMYGALIVEDDTDPVTDNERVLMIDDMKLTSDNKFKEGGMLAKFIERHDGRQGNTLLINGKEKSQISMNAGQVERWRIINAASARYFRLSVGGKAFQIIGTDGGLLQRAVSVSEVLLTPGERVDILAGPFEEGHSFFIETLVYDRVTFVKSRHEKFAEVLVGNRMPSVANVPTTLRKIEPLASSDAAINRKINFSVGASLRNGMDFLVNNDLHHHDKPVMVGELQVWEISNTSLMDHPFHLHGFFFQVLEVNGKPAKFLAWKDTINLAPKSKVKIAWLPDNRPGRWMYHCHILEHHEAGMMAHFDVVNASVGVEHEHRVTHCQRA